MMIPQFSPDKIRREKHGLKRKYRISFWTHLSIFIAAPAIAGALAMYFHPGPSLSLCLGQWGWWVTVVGLLAVLIWAAHVGADVGVSEEKVFWDMEEWLNRHIETHGGGGKELKQALFKK